MCIKKNTESLDPDVVFADVGDKEVDDSSTYVCSDGDYHLLSCWGDHSYSRNVWREKYGVFDDEGKDSVCGGVGPIDSGEEAVSFPPKSPVEHVSDSYDSDLNHIGTTTLEYASESHS